jgi:hypothetical protein
MAVETESVVAPRPCTDKPPFTIKTLRDQIPKHCFERSVWKSGTYLLADLCAVAALAAFSTRIDALPVPAVARAVLWALYWFFQGAVCTGECPSSRTIAAAGASYNLSPQLAPARRQQTAQRRRPPRGARPAAIVERVLVSWRLAAQQQCAARRVASPCRSPLLACPTLPPLPQACG